MKRRIKKIISYLYKKYVDELYIPYDTEFYLSLGEMITVDPRLHLWILRRGKKAVSSTKWQESFHHWSLSKLKEQGIEIRNKYKEEE